MPARRRHRRLFAVGQNADGQLGCRVASDSNCATSPVEVTNGPSDADGSTIMSVACGERHTLFLAENGIVWSVGNNEFGQLGRSTRASAEGSFSISPVHVATGVKIVQIAAGRLHSLALTDDGRVFSWGDASCKALGRSDDSTSSSSPRHVRHVTEVRQIAAGAHFSIALTDAGRIFQWGQMGAENSTELKTLSNPTPLEGVVNALPIAKIAAGSRHAVALTLAGSVLVWGEGISGQLGTQNLLTIENPIYNSMTHQRSIDVACGDAHTAILTSHGGLYVFGSNKNGQLGLSSDAQDPGELEKKFAPSPRNLILASSTDPDASAKRIAAGRAHTIFVERRPYAVPKATGTNNSGQLGIGNFETHLQPTTMDVAVASTTAIFAGWDQCFFIVDEEKASKCEEPGTNVEIRLPKRLTGPAIKSILSDKMEMMGLLESAFTSVSGLNASFVYEDARRFVRRSDAGDDTSLALCGVNADDAMEAFTAIAESSDAKKFGDLIVTSLEMTNPFPDVLMAARSNVAAKSTECIRLMTICPWIDRWLLGDEAAFAALHVPFAHTILQLPEFHRHELERWWRSLPLRHLKRVVSGLVYALAKMIRLPNFRTKKVVDLVKALKLLFLTNKKRRRTTTTAAVGPNVDRLPLSAFYINDLWKHVDLAQDYYKHTRKVQDEDPFRWSEFSFLFDGATKAQLIHIESSITMQERFNESRGMLFGIIPIQMEAPIWEVIIRRDHIVQDTVGCLQTTALSSPKDLQKMMRVRFADEEADDAGGVKKEFFMLLFQKLLHPDFGMFVEDPESHLIWFASANLAVTTGSTEELVNYFIVGLLMGLAVHNKVLVYLPFPLAIFKVILGHELNLDDLAELSPTEARNLTYLLDYDQDDVEDVFGLDFTVTYDVFGATKTVPLGGDGGSDRPVTKANRSDYVKRLVRHKLEVGYERAIAGAQKALRDGFKAVLQGPILEYLEPTELRDMALGTENYDWDELKRNTEYAGVYNADHPTIKIFWEIFGELDLEQRKKFLLFLMGTSRIPAQGMGEANCKIQPCSPDALPAAHTCFNLLDLPPITDKQELKRRLLISIEHTEGFTLV